ncbi:MAG: isoprenylcysteine carboxylmethyltransferase family protein [Chloroherpetonaceae bacterium]|nr:isoprenylcysteine carboxylmethyltransferase family protein [Chloroherpetonaceae bacterium]MDW8437301.1 isoprenylcysteine carboxylmethyltransferase family protein [Chloroherpetonaceae bacterium]
MVWRAAFLFAVLVALLGVLIALPAHLFNQLSSWRVWFALAANFVFFAGAAWRGATLGKLAKNKDDRQLQSASGRVAFAVRGAGLLAVYAGAIYEFSRSEPCLATAIVGVALALAAIVINRLAISALGKFWDKLVIKDDHRLITDGIYAFVRHPIYASYILLFFGYVALFQAPISAAILAIVSAIWFGKRIEIEEKMLIEKFGDEYRRYCERSKRLFPFVY